MAGRRPNGLRGRRGRRIRRAASHLLTPLLVGFAAAMSGLVVDQVPSRVNRGCHAVRGVPRVAGGGQRASGSRPSRARGSWPRRASLPGWSRSPRLPRRRAPGRRSRGHRHPGTGRPSGLGLGGVRRSRVAMPPTKRGSVRTHAGCGGYRGLANGASWPLPATKPRSALEGSAVSSNRNRSCSTSRSHRSSRRSANAGACRRSSWL
jgi:hypothetical protein